MEKQYLARLITLRRRCNSDPRNNKIAWAELHKERGPGRSESSPRAGRIGKTVGFPEVKYTTPATRMKNPPDGGFFIVALLYILCFSLYIYSIAGVVQW